MCMLYYNADLKAKPNVACSKVSVILTALAQSIFDLPYIIEGVIC